MRTLLLVIATVVVLAACAGVYLWMQPPPPPRATAMQRLTTRPSVPIAPPATTGESRPVLQSGEDVWIKTYDEKTGLLASQFRASRYDPQPDGAVNVTTPEAEFFFPDGRIVRMQGTHGRVIMPADATKNPVDKGPNAPPSRGELYDVTIATYGSLRPRHALLVCRVNNIAFDNDTFRIATESFTKPDGTLVLADQVPVQVRGDEYDFDGRGLTIRWNDRDRRLQLLEIAHGESLTIKSQQVLQGLSTGQSSARDVRSSSPEAIDHQPSTTNSLAAKRGGNDAVLVADVQPPPRLKKPASVKDAPSTQQSPGDSYRATFAGGVRITQAEQPLAQAETMRVDFFSGGDSAQPATPTTAGAGKKKAASARQHAAQPAATPASTPAAATQPLPQPVVIRWPGKLVVVPLDEPPGTLEPGEMNIEMSSNSTPVVLNNQGSEITCASFLYGGGGRSLLVRSSPQVPQITLKDSAGKTLRTSSIDYDQSTGKAVLQGAGNADFPLSAQQDGSTGLAHASWNKSCIITLAGQAREQMTIEQADVEGDVGIDHPRMKLRSDTLQVSFAPSPRGDASGNSQIKEFVAGGDVRCDLTDEQEKVHHITSDRLALATGPGGAEGKIVPKTVTADGNVHTFDEELDLRSGHLIAALSATTQPTDQPRVENLFAQQDVVFNAKDTSGRCQQLTATAVGDDYDVKLSGQPSASVTVGQSALVGPIINVQPKRQKMEVVGGGSLRGRQHRDAPSPSQPFEVTWSDGLTFDGAANLAIVNGNVLLTTESSDGSKNTGTAARLVMELADDPKATTKPASKPQDPMAASAGSMGNKIVRTVTLDENTELNSVLADAQGTPLRRLHLFARTARAEALAKRFVVPVPGRMLFEDRRATTQPTSGPASAPAALLGDLGGATAFQWQKQFVYDQALHRAEMTGQVVIVHQDSTGGGEPFRLEAARVAADLEEDPASTTAPATRPGGALLPDASSAKVKLLTADGGVRFISSQIRFDADQVFLDPRRNLLLARGTDRTPVQVYDEKGISSGSFSEISWNTMTQQIENMHDVQARVRKETP